MPKRLHRCVAFDVNARHASIIMIQLESDMQKDIDKQVSLLKKVTKERDDARNEVKESQQSAMNMFNEQKRHESQIDEVSCSNKVVD